MGFLLVCRNIGQKEMTIKEFVNGVILRSIFSFINNIVILFQISEKISETSINPISSNTFIFCEFLVLQINGYLNIMY